MSTSAFSIEVIDEKVSEIPLLKMMTTIPHVINPIIKPIITLVTIFFTKGHLPWLDCTLSHRKSCASYVDSVRKLRSLKKDVRGKREEVGRARRGERRKEKERERTGEKREKERTGEKREKERTGEKREKERTGEKREKERTRLKRRDPVHEHYGMTPPNVIPNLFRDLCFDPLGGRWTVDGQRCLQQRSAGFGS